MVAVRRRLTQVARRGVSRLLGLSDPRSPAWPVAEVASAGTATFTFLCRSELELMRARTFATKEEGTVEWIRSSVRPGQVFCDIGANIGLYSLLAAYHSGSAGVVFAFEPHVVNAGSLLANALANGLIDRVKVLSCALSDVDGVFEFWYSSLEPGAAFNQLSVLDRDDAVDQAKAPGAVEFKMAFSLDSLIRRGVVLPPHHVKIDVDGIEPRILRGMRQLLTSAHRPESVQVEIDPANAGEIHEFMRGVGYGTTHRHDTTNGKQAIAAGAHPASVAHNVIFRRP